MAPLFGYIGPKQRALSETLTVRTPEETPSKEEGVNTPWDVESAVPLWTGVISRLFEAPLLSRVGFSVVLVFCLKDTGRTVGAAEPRTSGRSTSAEFGQ